VGTKGQKTRKEAGQVLLFTGWKSVPEIGVCDVHEVATGCDIHKVRQHICRESKI
jgi:hypothetical protein